MRRLVGALVAIAALLALAPIAGAGARGQTPNPNRRHDDDAARAGAPVGTGEAVAGDLWYESEDGDEVAAEGVELTIESADGASPRRSRPTPRATSRSRCRGRASTR